MPRYAASHGLCGACQGTLQATDFSFPFIVLTGLVTVVVMLPIVISIAATSGNELEHIVVTAILVIIPMALMALVLHVPVAWLLRRLFHQTPFREALGHYEKQIQCTPFTGPDADHPYNHGLQAVTLRGFWQHFEGSPKLGKTLGPCAWDIVLLGCCGFKP
eukprot:Skav213151  [mRNA]  locus=scaffold31:2075:3530:- [translate_table: standard]